jgi:hypothetical protein
MAIDQRFCCAQRLGVTWAAVHGLIEQGHLRAEVVSGEGLEGQRLLRIRGQDIADFLDRARIKPRPTRPRTRTPTGPRRRATFG